MRFHLASVIFVRILGRLRADEQSEEQNMYCGFKNVFRQRLHTSLKTNGAFKAKFDPSNISLLSTFCMSTQRQEYTMPQETQTFNVSTNDFLQSNYQWQVFKKKNKRYKKNHATKIKQKLKTKNIKKK